MLLCLMCWVQPLSRSVERLLSAAAASLEKTLRALTVPSIHLMPLHHPPAVGPAFGISPLTTGRCLVIVCYWYCPCRHSPVTPGVVSPLPFYSKPAFPPSSLSMSASVPA